MFPGYGIYVSPVLGCIRPIPSKCVGEQTLTFSTQAILLITELIIVARWTGAMSHWLVSPLHVPHLTDYYFPYLIATIQQTFGMLDYRRTQHYDISIANR